MRWTWDTRKDALNLKKRGLALIDAVAVLDHDPFARSRQDAHSDGDRWRTIGTAGGFLLLFVVHTDPDISGTGRIVSVRRATKLRGAYEEGDF